MVRQTFVLLFSVLVAALIICQRIANRSKKSISKSISFLLAALIPPVIGNLIIIASESQGLSTIGYYIYFLGMDFVMYALLQFTFDYCMVDWPNNRVRNLVYGLLIADTIQFFFNPFFHQAFTTEAIIVDGAVYYKMIPYAGLAIHRVIVYSFFIAILLIFLNKVIHVPHIYSERYSAILIMMVAVGLWETYYIFSSNPINRSMIGYGVFGLVVFYFSLYYRPVRLLDRMLEYIASDLSDALFFFDDVGRCIWANNPGMKLVGLNEDDFDQAEDRLKKIFQLESLDEPNFNKRNQFTADIEGEVHYYILQKTTIRDDHGKVNGSFLTVRDNTKIQRDFERQQYIARHDPLTGLYTREYLYERIKRTLNSHIDTEYYVVYVDAFNFKVVNDIYGSDFGDFALKDIADWVRKTFGESQNSIYGRIHGDMFGICIPADEFHADAIENELNEYSIKDGKLEHPLLIHLGVYKVVEPGLDVSVMFDRARVALSTIKDEFSKHIAYYDDNMREKVLWDQLISSQLHKALNNREI